MMSRRRLVLLVSLTAAGAFNFGSLFGGGAPQKPLSNQEIREKYGVQLPSYSVVLERDGWECRRYAPMYVAECEYDKRPEGYELLGGYSQGGEDSWVGNSEY